MADGYHPHPPYEILQNRLIDFATMQKLRRFARFWDLIGNSGNFIETTPLILERRLSLEAFLDLQRMALRPTGARTALRWCD